MLQSIIGAELERKEAVKLLKIFTEIHKGDFISFINIKYPKQNEEFSDGFQLNIKAIKYHTIEDLEKLLGNYGLTAKEDKDTIIVYKPTKVDTKTRI